MNRGFRIKNKFHSYAWNAGGWHTYVLQVRAFWRWFSLAEFDKKKDAIDVLNLLINGK